MKCYLPRDCIEMDWIKLYSTRLDLVWVRKTHTQMAKIANVRHAFDISTSAMRKPIHIGGMVDSVWRTSKGCPYPLFNASAEIHNLCGTTPRRNCKKSIKKFMFCMQTKCLSTYQIDKNRTPSVRRLLHEWAMCNLIVLYFARESIEVHICFNNIRTDRYCEINSKKCPHTPIDPLIWFQFLCFILLFIRLMSEIKIILNKKTTKCKLDCE